MYWLIPLAITILVWAWAGQGKYTEGYMNFGMLFTFPVAFFVTILAWVIYFMWG